MLLRRAQIDEQVRKKVRERVKQLLKEKQGDPEQSDSADENPEGSIYLFDASDRSRNIIALEFDTRKEFEQYRKDHDLDPRTKIKILDEGKGKKPVEDDSEKRSPAKEDDSKKRSPTKKEEAPVDKKEVKDLVVKKLEEKKTEKEAPKKTTEKPEEKKPEEPKELDHTHPTKIPEGIHRQVAIKDRLIDEFGVDAKDWKVHKLHPSQLPKGVSIKFPDGSEKKYGELSPDEKSRVDKAVGEGLAASKGIGDYTSVSPAALQYNMAVNLGNYDTGVEESKNESTEPVSSDNAGKFSSALRENGRTLVRKYQKSTSNVSYPLAGRFIDEVSDAASEGLRDGSISGVSQADLDSYLREDVKRMLNQEIESRRRSLGDHGVRHVSGNAHSTMSMLSELQHNGIKITGKQKLMALSIMANHDIGYTVGDAATDITKSKNHKQYSKELVDQEKERYDKIFGAEDGEKLRNIIATHDDPIIDWEQDPIGSTVRLADNTSLFGADKVQDLFLRSKRATQIACKLRLAAEAKPDDKKLQDDIKNQMHEVVDSEEFDEGDRESLHAQINEMSEGKFSTTKDILSRFSGELEGFKFDSEKKMMHVNMRYSSEGQMVGMLFGDEAETKQFDKFANDLGGHPVYGKRGHTVFTNKEGKKVFQLDIDGFGEQDSPTTAAMKDFQKRTARSELRCASMMMYPPPPASEREIVRAQKTMEEAKDKFSSKEWKELEAAFEEGKIDPDALAKKLSAWPLLESESKYLKSKTASERMVQRMMIAMLSDRVAAEFCANRGNQTQRKDKDLMEDTGGISKNRQRLPEKNPPRSDSANRYRTKDKPAEERDKDVDNSDVEKKEKTASNFEAVARTALSHSPRTLREAVQKNLMDIARHILAIAQSVLASSSEKEVERLMRAILPGTPFAGKTHGVGGFIRDEVLGIDAKDLDVVVEMRNGAEKLTAFLHQMFPVETTSPHRLGAGYPIWQITFKEDIDHDGKTYATQGAVIEFADTQKEMFPDQNSRQRVVEYGTLREDIDRRDFTVNSLLKDLTTGEIVDLTGSSLQDIKNGVLRGNPGVDFDKILRDDPLRMIRCIRFQAKYGWSVPLSVLKSIRRNADRIQIVSGERIRDELIKIMKIGKLAQAIRLMKTVGLLQYVLPEIQEMEGVEHEYSRGVHAEGDVLRHTLLVLQNAKPGVENQLAALLHDVGKPDSQEVMDGLIKFIGHEKVSGEIAEAILRRLKFDGDVIRKVRVMVENHMRPHHLLRGGAGSSGLRRFIRDVGVELVDAILDLAEADQLGNLPPKNTIPDLRQKIDALRIPVQKAEELPIDGMDIQRILKIGPGKQVGDALKFLRDKKFEMEQDGLEMTEDIAESLILDRFVGRLHL